MRAAHPGDPLPARLVLRARSRRDTRARSKVRVIAGWAALTTVVTVLSVLFHLATPVGRAAAADAFSALLSSRIRGTMHIGAVTRLDFAGVEMSDFRVTSPAGARVFTADRITGEIAWLESLRGGAIVLTSCDMEGGGLRLTGGPGGQIDLIHSLEVPDDRFMIPFEMRDVRMQHQTIVFALPGAPAEIEMANVHGMLDMTMGHTLLIRLDALHGHLNVPIVDIGFAHLGGRLRSDDGAPLVVRMRLDLEVADPSMEIRYTAPGAIGREGAPGLGIELGVDVPDARHVGRPRSRETAGD